MVHTVKYSLMVHAGCQPPSLFSDIFFNSTQHFGFIRACIFYAGMVAYMWHLWKDEICQKRAAPPPHSEWDIQEGVRTQQCGDILTDVICVAALWWRDQPERAVILLSRWPFQQTDRGKRGETERHEDGRALSNADICTLQYVDLLGCDHAPKY